MRPGALVGSLIVSTCLSLAMPARAQVAVFAGTFADATTRSNAEGKLLVAVVHVPWCASCYELDAKVLAAPEAAEATRDAIVVKVDGESGEGVEVAKRYHVVGYPTVLFVNADGEEVDRLFGVTTLAEFVGAVRDFPAGKGTLADAEKRFAERPNDFELAHEIGVRHAIKGHDWEAKTYFALVESAQKGLKATPRLPVPKEEGAQAEYIRRVNEMTHASQERAEELLAEGRYALAKYTYLRGARDYNRAKVTLLALRSQFPKSPVAKRALYELAHAFHGLGNEKQARETLDKYLAESRGEPAAANAYAWFCLRERFQIERGIDVAVAGLARNPKDDSLWDTLAELYAKKGDVAKANEAVDKALGLKPNDPYYKAQKKKLAAK